MQTSKAVGSFCNLLRALKWANDKYFLVWVAMQTPKAVGSFCNLINAIVECNLLITGGQTHSLFSFLCLIWSLPLNLEVIVEWIDHYCVTVSLQKDWTMNRINGVSFVRSYPAWFEFERSERGYKEVDETLLLHLPGRRESTVFGSRSGGRIPGEEFCVSVEVEINLWESPLCGDSQGKVTNSGQWSSQAPIEACADLPSDTYFACHARQRS